MKGIAGTSSSFGNWCEVTSWHGFSDFYKTNSWVSKIFWLTVILFSLFNISLQLVYFMLNFLNPNKWTVAVSYEADPDGGLLFPNVTVCNFNQINNTKMKELNLSENLVRYFLMSNAVFHPSYRPGLFNYTKEKQEYDMYQESHSSGVAEEMFDNLSMSCEGTFKACVWRGKLIEDCCHQHVKSVIGTFQSCLMITMPRERNGSPARQWNPGYDGGLHLLLDPAFSHHSLLKRDPGSMDAGFKVYMGLDPNMEFETWNPLFAGHGLHYWVSMEPTRMIMKPSSSAYTYFYQPQVPCVGKGEVQLIYGQGDYTQKSCIKDCAHALFLTMCNCTFPSNFRQDISECTPTESFECGNVLYANTSKKNHSVSGYYDCVGRCQRLCDTAYIHHRETITRLSHFWKNDILATVRHASHEPWLSEDVIWNMTVLTLYYSTYMYRVHEYHERFPVDSLISKMGGIMGLWAGMSLITICQMLIYFAYSIARMVCGIQRPNPDEKAKHSQ